MNDQDAKPQNASTDPLSGDSGVVEIERDMRLVGVARKCGVLIDGEKIGELWVNGKIQITLPPGQHELQARLSWVKSAPHSVAVGAGEMTTVGFALPRIFELHRIFLGPFWGPLYFKWR
jgi:hypothetical protein